MLVNLHLHYLLIWQFYRLLHVETMESGLFKNDQRKIHLNIRFLSLVQFCFCFCMIMGIETWAHPPWKNNLLMLHQKERSHRRARKIIIACKTKENFTSWPKYQPRIKWKYCIYMGHLSSHTITWKWNCTIKKQAFHTRAETWLPAVWKTAFVVEMQQSWNTELKEACYKIPARI